MQSNRRCFAAKLAGICLAFVALLSGPNSFAQGASPLIQNVNGRRVVSLNGDWHYIADPHDQGQSRRYYLNGKPFGNRDFVEYDFNTSPTLARARRLELPKAGIAAIRRHGLVSEIV